MATIKHGDKKKILALLIKVKKLSEAGEKGEKDNAQDLLKKLLKKYNLKDFDLVKTKKRTFKLKNFTDCLGIMTHCILDTAGDIPINGLLRKKEVYCKLTDEQYVDVCEKYNHYYPLFHEEMTKLDKQKDDLLKAFLIKNNLGITEGNEKYEGEDVSGIKDMMGSVKENRYNKKIKSIKLINESVL